VSEPRKNSAADTAASKATPTMAHSSCNCGKCGEGVSVE
jgi:hypothetical protein